MSKLIQLKAGFCGNQLFYSKDEKWVSNRHWMLRPWHCKILKSTPEATRELDEALISSVIEQMQADTYAPAQLSPIEMHGSRMLYQTDGGTDSVVWVDKEYAKTILDEAWEDLGITIWTANADSPIFVTAGKDRDEDMLLAALMPCRVDVAKDTPGREAFKAWVAGQ